MEPVAQRRVPALADLPRWSHSTHDVMPALEAYVEGFERSQSAGGRRGWRRLALGAALSQ